MEKIHEGLPVKEFKSVVQIKEEYQVQPLTPKEEETEVMEMEAESEEVVNDLIGDDLIPDE